MAKEVTRKKLLARLQRREPVVLVDLLPAMVFSHSHLPGAVNLPHDRVRDLAPAKLLDRSAQIVVYHANAFHLAARMSAERLERLGYLHVSYYADGKQDWMEAGLPVESCLGMKVSA